MLRFVRFSIFFGIFLFSGCGPNTLHQATLDGGRVLTAEELRQHFSDRKVHIESSAFDSLVVFHGDGSLTAKSYEGDKDRGKWSINGNQLCITFARWGFSDRNCFIPVSMDTDRILFFTPSGAYKLEGTFLSSRKITDANQYSIQSSSPLPRPHSKEAIPRSPLLSNDSRDQNLQQTLTTLAQNCPGCNFEGAKLKGSTLIGAILSGANLSGADLSDTNLRRAKLNGANLADTNLIRANLAGADLRNANLSGANLHGANLIRADLTGADLTRADLSKIHTESTKGLPQL